MTSPTTSLTLSAAWFLQPPAWNPAFPKRKLHVLSLAAPSGITRHSTGIGESLQLPSIVAELIMSPSQTR